MIYSIIISREIQYVTRVEWFQFPFILRNRTFDPLKCSIFGNVRICLEVGFVVWKKENNNSKLSMIDSVRKVRTNI